MRAHKHHSPPPPPLLTASRQDEVRQRRREVCPPDPHGLPRVRQAAGRPVLQGHRGRLLDPRHDLRRDRAGLVVRPRHCRDLREGGRPSGNPGRARGMPHPHCCRCFPPTSHLLSIFLYRASSRTRCRALRRCAPRTARRSSPVPSATLSDRCSSSSVSAARLTASRRVC